ncbi:hypothetical protein BFP70_16575 [Thioclava sp. SK-1]|nr:hypothetical protein BFP70_16575 [Thioclava sp. SK-1]
MGATAPQAGPWARGAGNVFASISHDAGLDHDPTGWHSIYLEYGLSDATTALFDIGSDGDHKRDLLAILQRQFPLSDDWGVASWQIGLGARSQNGDTSPLIKLGANWGRGYSTHWAAPLPRSGWISAEAALFASSYITYEAQMDDDLLRYTQYLVLELQGKLDLTAGLTLSDRLKWINQLQLFKADETPLSADLSSTLAFGLGTTPLTLETGVITPVAGGGQTRAKLALWISF